MNAGIAEQLAEHNVKHMGRKRAPKYHNIKINGYDSKRENARAHELKLLERAGKIVDLREQVPFELIPAQRGQDGRVVERSVVWRADFVYIEAGQLVAEDVKSKPTKAVNGKRAFSTRTAEYRVKRKLLLFRYGIRIKEV